MLPRRLRRASLQARGANGSGAQERRTAQHALDANQQRRSSVAAPVSQVNLRPFISHLDEGFGCRKIRRPCDGDFQISCAVVPNVSHITRDTLRAANGLWVELEVEN